MPFAITRSLPGAVTDAIADNALTLNRVTACRAPVGFGIAALPHSRKTEDPDRPAAKSGLTMPRPFSLVQMSPPEAPTRTAIPASGIKTRQGRPRGLDAPKDGTRRRSDR